MATAVEKDTLSRTTTYVREHHVKELFAHLTQLLAYHQPSDPRAFLIEEVNKMRADKSGSGVPTHLFTEDDLETMFRLIDVAKRGSISRSQLRNTCINLSAASAGDGDGGASAVGTSGGGEVDGRGGNAPLSSEVEAAIRQASDANGNVGLVQFKQVLSQLLHIPNMWAAQ